MHAAHDHPTSFSGLSEGGGGAAADMLREGAMLGGRRIDVGMTRTAPGGEGRL